MTRAFAGSFGAAGVAERLVRALGGAPTVVLTETSPGDAVAWIEGSRDCFHGTAGPCTVAGCGVFDDLDALASEVGGRNSTSVGHRLAAAYGVLGSRLPGRLHGRFALAAWNSATREALLAVDRLGAMPLFAAQRAASVVFASELAPLLRLLPTQPPPDDGAVVQWLANGLVPEGRTLYDGVRRFGAGEAWILERGRVERVRYWRPRFHEPLREPRETLAAALREAVRGSVARRLPTDGGTAVLVSGGLDSATVSALAAGEASTRVRGYSAVFPDHPEVDESGLVRGLADHVGLPLELLEVRQATMFRPALEYLAEWAVPLPSPNFHFNRRLVALAARDGAAVVLDGEGGDELFALAPFYLADLVRRGSFRRALQLLRRIPGYDDQASLRDMAVLVETYVVKGASPGAVRAAFRAVRPPERRTGRWFTPRASRLLAAGDEMWAWKREREGPLWWSARVDELITKRHRVGMHDGLRRMRGPLVRAEHPLLDDLELVELVLRLPPEALFDASFDRPLIREAMAGLIPDAIRLRREKSFFDALFLDSLQGVDWEAATRLVGARDARVAAYVQLEPIRELVLGAPAERRTSAWAWTVWRLLNIEAWLRSLEDAEAPSRLAAELYGGPKVPTAGGQISTRRS